jgi:transposase
MAATSLRQRILIQDLSQMGLPDQEIAVRMKIGRSTVRKWRRRLSKQGSESAMSVMGRPKRGPLSTFPSEMVKLLEKWRTAHPGWGAKTLWAELSQDPNWTGQPLPSRAGIARWLKQAGYVKHYERHGRLPQVVSPTEYCHEEWEMDAKGHEAIPTLGLVSLIDVNDVHSHARLASYPCWVGHERVEHTPNMADYQLVLRRTFVRWGLPDRLAVDHAHVFFDVQGSTPFPTQFHMWLLALGVQVTFCRLAQPRDQGMTERSHQIWWGQVVQGQSFGDLEHLCQALEARCGFLNNVLPCRSLGEQAPLVAFPQASQPRRPYRPEWEEGLMDLQRVYNFLGACHWVRLISSSGTLSLGCHRHSLGKEWYNLEVDVHFDPTDPAFIVSAPGHTAERVRLPWLTKVYLMGEFSPLVCFSQLQLMLPFSLENFRTLQLSRLFETQVL